MSSTGGNADSGDGLRAAPRGIQKGKVVKRPGFRDANLLIERQVYPVDERLGLVPVLVPGFPAELVPGLPDQHPGRHAQGDEQQRQHTPEAPGTLVLVEDGGHPGQVPVFSR